MGRCGRDGSEGTPDCAGVCVGGAAGGCAESCPDIWREHIVDMGEGDLGRRGEIMHTWFCMSSSSMGKAARLLCGTPVCQPPLCFLEG